MSLAKALPRLVGGAAIVAVGRQLPPGKWRLVSWGGAFVFVWGLQALLEDEPAEEPGGIAGEVVNLPPPPQLSEVRGKFITPGMLSVVDIPLFGERTYRARVEWQNRSGSAATLQPVFRHAFVELDGDEEAGPVWAAPVLTLSPGETRLIDYDVPLDVVPFVVAPTVKATLTATLAGFPEAQLDFRVFAVV